MSSACDEESAPFLMLSDELLLMCFELLVRQRDLVAVGRVCRAFHRLIAVPALWRHVDLSRPAKFAGIWDPPSNEFICKLTHRFTRIVLLKLEHCTTVTPSTLEKLSKKCKHVRQLSLRGCSGITDWPSAFGYLRKLPLLDTLNLSDIEHLVDSREPQRGILKRGITLLAPTLTDLNLSGCNLINVGALLAMTRLRVLDVSHNAFSTRHSGLLNSLAELILKLPLEVVRASDCEGSLSTGLASTTLRVLQCSCGSVVMYG
eukprot:TRINITY_DN16316_c0_g1_i1.p1 TRINITY_DN16316_c0_g1~~TRINITY_DN16316_c0_g1_i1.p1  ORF type:complete len:260 (+),score=86.80 TRINITY_DN16316_c0_g1_i1:115-894(+)